MAECIECGQPLGAQRQVWMSEGGPVVVCSDTCLKLARLRAELTGQMPESAPEAAPEIDDLPEVEGPSAAEIADRGQGDTSKPSTLEALEIEPGQKPQRKR